MNRLMGHAAGLSEQQVRAIMDLDVTAGDCPKLLPAVCRPLGVRGSQSSAEAREKLELLPAVPDCLAGILFTSFSFRTSDMTSR